MVNIPTESRTLVWYRSTGINDTCVQSNRTSDLGSKKILKYSDGISSK